VSAGLSVRALIAGYPGVPVLHGVDLEIAPGRLTAILGANGAGKTTMLKALIGLLPRTGTVTFDGAPLPAGHVAAAVRRGLSLVAEGRELFPQMTVRENLELGAYTLPPSARAARLAEVLALFPRLHERRSQPAGTMSGGEQQMAAIGRALMARPRMLMLDEPSLGLAPKMVDELLAIARGLCDAGTTVLLVEQNAQKALAVADDAYVLERGRIVAQGPSAELARSNLVRSVYLGVTE
jgi:branched-chain amino acid transport system ATP-binding protein